MHSCNSVDCVVELRLQGNCVFSYKQLSSKINVVINKPTNDRKKTFSQGHEWNDKED